MQESHVKLPPWSKKRRITTSVALAGFILLASGFIGIGLYQTGVESGIIKPAMTKESLLQSLLNDSQFVRTIKHTAQLRECVNPKKQFKLTYESPLHMTKVASAEDNCTVFATIHPTGSTTTISMKRENIPREKLVLSLSKEFSTVQTDILSGTAYETSVVSGVRNGTPTTIYVIRVDRDISWVITYLPTSTLIDGKVLELIESFRLI